MNRTFGNSLCWFNAVLASIFCLSLGSISSLALAQENGDAAHPETVSSEVCATCHSDEYEAWQRSDHSWALREPRSENVLGDFDDAEFTLNGETTQFHKKGEQFYIKTLGPNGTLVDYEVKYTVGVRPLQQYLLETQEGRLQSFDVAWDTEEKRWFHLYPDQNLKPGEGLHWTGPYKNWNGRCAECHQTDYVKGYDPKDDQFHSEWSELTIGCGACHGNGADHVAWAEDEGAYAEQSPVLALTKGFDITLPMEDGQKNIEICAGCHSRRSTIFADSPVVGTPFDDSYNLALLRQGLYHADGQINDEVYVYGSFLQSKMYAKGVTCSNCHDPHSGELAGIGNTTCLQCHSPAGNPDFVSLPKKEYDTPAHHHHPEGSEGAQCVSCHMPAKNFMQVDPRRDHSFRVPRPDLTVTIGTPNACGTCHESEGPEWAAARVKDWFPDGRSGTYHYGMTLARGRANQGPEAVAALADLALDETQADIVRASAIDLATAGLNEQTFNRLLPLLEDDSAVVRSAAMQMLDLVPAGMRVDLATGLLKDPALTLRLGATRLLTGQPLDPEIQAEFDRNMAIFQDSLIGRADFPETQLQIAGLALVLRDVEAAKRAFLEATKMDPQLEQAWVMVSRIQQAQNLPDEAEVTLLKAAAAIPESAEIQNQLGGLYFNTRQNAKAVDALKRSLELGPATPQVLDLLANNLYETGDLTDAIEYARQLKQQFPGFEPSELTQKLLTLKVLERP
mgnify:FL=1